MQRRIYGIETEYAASCVLPDGSTWPIEEVVELLLTHQDEEHEFLGNGARFYGDVGSHPEYATGECATLRDIVTHDKAGERIVEARAKVVEKSLRPPYGAVVAVLKNNVDSEGHTYGCHENYLVPRKFALADLADQLAPFFATRQLIAGAGLLRQVDGKTVYCLSQRASFIRRALSMGTTGDRGMISGRDMAHADQEQYRRLHVIVGDANMSETTTFLKVGSTDLILRLIEAGDSLEDLRLANPGKAILDTSLDITGGARIALQNGEEISALELQRRLYRRARRFAEGTGLVGSDGQVGSRKQGRDASETARVLELWGRTLHALATGDRTLIERDIDWAIKLRLLEDYQAKHGLAWSHARLKQLDYAYHDVRRDRGLYYLLERRGRVSRVTSDLAIFEAKTRAPLTRARLRGNFLQWAREAGVRYAVDWEVLSLQNKTWQTVRALDPFQSFDLRVEQLKRETGVAYVARRKGWATSGLPRSPSVRNSGRSSASLTTRN